jgi:hypothetical protein
LRARADDDFQHQARFTRHCDVGPVLANFIRIGLLLVRMFSASEAVEFIQFDVLRRNASDDFFVGGFGLDTGPLNPSLDGGRMNAFDARHSFRAQTFKALLDSALDFLLRSLEIIEGRAVPVTKSAFVQIAANDCHRLAALQSVTTMIG